MHARKLSMDAAAAIVASAVLSSPGAVGDHWKFNVVNNSAIAAVEFRTQANGEWSPNWISDKIEPGDRFNMDFRVINGDCTVRTEIRFADGSKFDAPIDYCKVNNLYIHDGNVSWD